MGYQVHKSYKRKDGSFRWRLIFESYKDNVRSQRHIPKSEWPAAGFAETMSLEEAKAWATSINLHDKTERVEVRRQAIRVRLQKEGNVDSIFLPKVFVLGFEHDVLEREFSKSENSAKTHRSHWHGVMRLIAEVKLQPKEWSERPAVIYQYFATHKFSVSYAEKLLRILNAWGMFVSRKTNNSFIPIKAPTGSAREEIADKYFEKGTTKASDPITLVDLAALQQVLREDLYNWMFISIWFGLRSSEIDSLHKPVTWRVVQDPKISVLWVYQSKLKAVPREKRWKLIPIIYPEQIAAVEMIRSGNFKRPLVKTLRGHLNKPITTYGGRKNFTDLMLDRGHPLEDVSAWLGHTTIELTWRVYRDRLTVRLSKKNDGSS